MRVLFDHNVPFRLARYLEGHTARTADELGWARLANGELLKEAETAAFDVFLTGDKNLQYQQNLSKRAIAILVLEHSAWPLVRVQIPAVVSAVNAATPGVYLEIEIPLPRKN